MKKILLLFILSQSLNISAQQATDSIHHVTLFKQPYNGANGAITWLGIASFAMIVGGTSQYIATNPDVPFSSKKIFNTETIADAKTQNTLHTVFGIGIGVAAISMVMATNDMVYYFKNKSKHTAFKIKVSPVSVGLCLNFK